MELGAEVSKDHFLSPNATVLYCWAEIELLFSRLRGT